MDLKKRQPGYLLAAFFAASFVLLLVGFLTGLIAPPRIGMNYEPADVMGPMGAIFALVGGMFSSLLTVQIARDKSVVQIVVPLLLAGVSAVVGMGCGYGCFSAVWAT